jgi:hypothetical protein
MRTRRVIVMPVVGLLAIVAIVTASLRRSPRVVADGTVGHPGGHRGQ